VHIARARFDEYGPLLNLGRADEALPILRDCLQVFQQARDIAAIGNVLGAIADVEDALGHGDTAIRMQRDALRYLAQ